ncbi:general transcription factor 3C polypeptide 4-like [Haliotis rufescens]|uniref:general transcription factor 3C polypeptide 4-like n=1 Tax=Haliotis rufescens TaxID=6454 RepID=UPI00201EB64A|nr:general transcription factor 3C polypeptide 4-like [Haliotis rufescens]
MAVAGTFVATFPSNITACNAVAWSDDNRLAIATDGGLFLLELSIRPSHVDGACHFLHSNIPPSKEDAVSFVPFDFEKFSKSLETEEIHQLMLDRTLCPRTGCQTSSKGYKVVSWSPAGGDIAGRCVLASVSHDHQVCIHTTSDTKKTWKKVADLSQMYASNNPLPGDLTFSALRGQTYKLAAMELSWSDCYQGSQGEGPYSLLAVCMKNGDVVLWKVHLPCLHPEDCRVVKVLSLHTSIPTSVSWCRQLGQDKRAVLAVGYNSGVIHLMDVTLGGDEVSVRPACLYGEKDDLRISCMCWKKLKDCYLLISSKEQYLLTHSVKVDNKLSFSQKATVTGSHWMAGTGLASHDSITVLGSADGVVQKVTVTEMRNKSAEIVVDTSLLPFPKDDKYLWSCHGTCLSPNGSFCAAVFTPSSRFCHLEMREPVKLQVIHVEEKEIIHEYAGSLCRAGDVFEAYRQSICCEVDPQDLLKEHRLNITDLNDQPMKALKIYRFLFLVLDNLLRNTIDEEEEGFQPISKDIEKFTDEIHGRLIKQRFEDINKCKGKLSQLEQKIVTHMCQWLERSSNETLHQYAESDVVIKVMGRVMDLPPSACTICEESLQMDPSSCKCVNGHTFGACCLTLLPCDQIPYRKCQTCGALSLHLEQLKDITWLAADLTRCALCEGQLL